MSALREATYHDRDGVAVIDAFRFQREHFREGLDESGARELFRASVGYVEIETFTYCNRRCWFCPNARIPQRQERAGNQYMGEPLYLRILDELASVAFRGHLQFGRYNEPLADRIIIDRIRQARERLPGAWLYMHTNGDFLTRDYLVDLRTAGLDGLEVQTYLGNDERYDEAKMLVRQQNQLDRLGLRVRTPMCAAPGFRHRYETDFPGMVVSVDARNFAEVGTDRGGLLPIRKEARTAPCMIPFTSLYVDWTGDTMPCCNLRSDVPEHRGFIACRLQDGHSIFAAYAALHAWRKSLIRFGEKSGPCATCRYDEYVVPPEQAEALERIYAAIDVRS